MLQPQSSPIAPLRLEEELDPQGGRTVVNSAFVHLADGTNTTVEVDPDVLEILVSLDGRVPLHEVVQTAADRLELTEAETSQLRREALDVSRELLELGALRFH